MKYLIRILLVAVSVGLGAAIVRAEDLGAIKARMERRLHTVVALKDRQVVGENNRGYLEPRTSITPADEKAMSDENADRREVYAAIARQTGASIEEVGQRRSQQIAAGARRGDWLQSPDGTWYQKQ